ncbi:MAG: type II toxin-antitoxin system VapC family toxin [Candidatus Aegiribacteria sp.]|nr:type II toxin-antitoxin system VapC family toxin [Candidatus Aegiribacteria sp.]
MYLIDTDICIYLIKKKSEYLLQRFESEKAFNIGVSAISVAELEYGIAKSAYPERNRIALLEFLSCFEIVPFTDLDTQAYGAVRAFLNKKGTPIGPYDLMIAAQCLTRDLILVTNNVKEFQRVPDLHIENWIQESGC